MSRIYQPLMIPNHAKAVLILAAPIFFHCNDLVAQTFKCTDGDRKTTYSNTNCDALGLKDAGKVRDRINVHSAFKPPAQAQKPPHPSDTPAKSEATNSNATPAPQKSAEPKRRCLDVMTKKGPITNCEDKPQE